MSGNTVPQVTLVVKVELGQSSVALHSVPMGRQLLHILPTLARQSLGVWQQERNGSFGGIASHKRLSQDRGKEAGMNVE